jgi:hypothetical protein
MLFPVSGAQVKFFAAKTGPENAFEMSALKLVHCSRLKLFGLSVLVFGFFSH